MNVKGNRFCTISGASVITYAVATVIEKFERGSPSQGFGDQV